MKCYTIEKESFLRAPNLDLHEALGLMLLARNFKDPESLTDVSFDNSALNALMKIESVMPDNLRLQCHAALEKTSTCLAYQALVNYSNEINVYS